MAAAVAAARRLTVQEAVVLEAAAAEQSVEGVQALLALHRASVGPVDVRRALGGQSAGQLLLRQLLVPGTQKKKNTHQRWTHTHIYVSKNKKYSKEQTSLSAPPESPCQGTWMRWLQRSCLRETSCCRRCWFVLQATHTHTSD